MRERERAYIFIYLVKEKLRMIKREINRERKIMKKEEIQSERETET